MPRPEPRLKHIWDKEWRPCSRQQAAEAIRKFRKAKSGATIRPGLYRLVGMFEWVVIDTRPAA
jgi:hypothetical protein